MRVLDFIEEQELPAMDGLRENVIANKLTFQWLMQGVGLITYRTIAWARQQQVRGATINFSSSQLALAISVALGATAAGLQAGITFGPGMWS